MQIKKCFFWKLFSLMTCEEFEDYFICIFIPRYLQNWSILLPSNWIFNVHFQILFCKLCLTEFFFVFKHCLESFADREVLTSRSKLLSQYGTKSLTRFHVSMSAFCSFLLPLHRIWPGGLFCLFGILNWVTYVNQDFNTYYCFGEHTMGCRTHCI